MGQLGAVPDLDTLVDVNIETPLNDQVLAFNSASGRWENQDIKDVNVTIEELQNTLINAPVNGQVIMFQNNKWVNQFSENSDRPFQFFMASFN
jgi:hypothetical protein